MEPSQMLNSACSLTHAQIHSHRICLIISLSNQLQLITVSKSYRNSLFLMLLPSSGNWIWRYKWQTEEIYKEIQYVQVKHWNRNSVLNVYEMTDLKVFILCFLSHDVTIYTFVKSGVHIHRPKDGCEHVFARILVVKKFTKCCIGWCEAAWKSTNGYRFLLLHSLATPSCPPLQVSCSSSAYYSLVRVFVQKLICITEIVFFGCEGKWTSINNGHSYRLTKNFKQCFYLLAALHWRLLS